jgi:hypothetical protein
MSLGLGVVDDLGGEVMADAEGQLVLRISTSASSCEAVQSLLSSSSARSGLMTSAVRILSQFCSIAIVRPSPCGVVAHALGVAHARRNVVRLQDAADAQQ